MWAGARSGGPARSGPCPGAQYLHADDSGPFRRRTSAFSRVARRVRGPPFGERSRGGRFVDAVSLLSAAVDVAETVGHSLGRCPDFSDRMFRPVVPGPGSARWPTGPCGANGSWPWATSGPVLLENPAAEQLCTSRLHAMHSVPKPAGGLGYMPDRGGRHDDDPRACAEPGRHGTGPLSTYPPTLPPGERLPRRRPHRRRPPSRDRGRRPTAWRASWTPIARARPGRHTGEIVVPAGHRRYASALRPATDPMPAGRRLTAPPALSAPALGSHTLPVRGRLPLQ